MVYGATFWYFGGWKLIHLHMPKKMSFALINNLICTYRTRTMFYHLPCFYLPLFKANLKAIFIYMWNPYFKFLKKVQVIGLDSQNFNLTNRSTLTKACFLRSIIFFRIGFKSWFTNRLSNCFNSYDLNFFCIIL
jgi:arginine exporter protein ArgO